MVNDEIIDEIIDQKKTFDQNYDRNALTTKKILFFFFFGDQWNDQKNTFFDRENTVCQSNPLPVQVQYHVYSII